MTVKVQPGASRDEIIGINGDAIKVRVAAQPEAGRANAAVCALFASVLGLRRREVTVVAGHASRVKKIAIEGCSKAEFSEYLGALGIIFRLDG